LGKPLEEITRILWPKTNHEVYMREYRELFMDKNLVIPRIDGAVDAVKKIKNSGFKLGVISGKLFFFLKKHLEESGFDIKWFDEIASFETTKKHKPDPEPIFYVMDKLKIKPGETLYVGDAKFDYECAKNAKIEYVAVLTGCLKREELKTLGVKNIINSVSDLPKFLGLK
jgi:pyrophosphatase PpaX